MLKYCIILFNEKKELGLTWSEYVVANYIYHMATNPNSKKFGWCYATLTTKAELFDLSRRAIMKVQDSLIEKGLVEKDLEGHTRTTAKWYNTVVIANESFMANKVHQRQLDGEQKTPVMENKRPHDGEQKTPNNNIYTNIDKDKNSSPNGSPLIPEKKKTMVDHYCIGYESHFKIKPYLTDEGKISMPVSEVMALQRIKKRFGEIKAIKFFTPLPDRTVPIFSDERIITDKWVIARNYSPTSLEKRLIEIKTQSDREAANGN